MQTEPCDVVHVVNQMRPGGIETMVLDLVRHSAFRSRIFSLESTTEQLLRGWPGLASVADGLDGFDRPPGLVPALVVRLARRLRELGPKTVFLHRISPLLYGGLAARMARVNTIVHVEHDVWHYDDPRRRRLLKWSARVVRPTHFAVSDHIADVLGEMVPATRVRVVKAGVDLVRFNRGDRQAARLALGLPQDVPIIGTAGRLEAVKGHQVLIAAMQHLAPDIRLVIAGRGSEQARLAAQAEGLGVQSRVHFLGHRDDLERILPALDVFCLPSLSEGLPRVIMEVQGADIPVVATDVGSVRQVVDPATGRMVPAKDPPALARAISDCLASPPEIGACRRFAEANFSLDRMIANYDGMTEQQLRAA